MNNQDTSKVVLVMLAVAALVDVVFAGCIATFGASILHAIGIGVGAGSVATGAVSFVGWIVAFFIALWYGFLAEVALAVVTLIVLVAYYLSKQK